MNGITAWQMLHRIAKVRAGQTILVHGANGGSARRPHTYRTVFQSWVR